MKRALIVEQAAIDAPLSQKIIGKHQQQYISCHHYGELFNRKAQNFRTQKQNPALILAHKRGKKVLPTPASFGIGGKHNYYFSHMLNCLYDCRYCFLQGMYQSANYVLFVNYQDFIDEIKAIAKQHYPEEVYFFSGYDCDSLAFDPISEFLEHFLPVFATIPNAILELRTKSSNINALLQHSPLANVIVAYSLTPTEIAEQVEHKAPSIAKRLNSIKQLAELGWPIGLRFDPLIYASDYQTLYSTLITEVFNHVDGKAIHSVSTGPLRFPTAMYKKLIKLYPDDKLLAQPLYQRQNYYSYRQATEEKIQQLIITELSQHIEPAIIFRCHTL